MRQLHLIVDNKAGKGSKSTQLYLIKLRYHCMGSSAVRPRIWYLMCSIIRRIWKSACLSYFCCNRCPKDASLRVFLIIGVDIFIYFSKLRTQKIENDCLHDMKSILVHIESIMRKRMEKFNSRKVWVWGQYILETNINRF